MRLKHLFLKHSINYLLSSSRFINGRASSFHTTKLSGTTDCIFSNTYDGIGATLSKHSTLHLLCPSSSRLVFSNNTRTIHSYESETTPSGFDDGKKPFEEAYGISSDNVTNELVVESTCAISNEFLSRFCWVIRGKMFEVFKEWREKIIYDWMLHILTMVMSEVESKYFDRIIIGSVMVTPSPDIYADCWRMLTELCNARIVHFSRSGGNSVMMRFASAVFMIRYIYIEVEWEFDCRRFPQSKFYSELEHIRGNDQTRKAAKTDYVDGEEEGHAMIDGYIKAGKLERAKETLESFLCRKFIPDIQMTENIYMVLLRSFARRGDAEGANRISRAMESAGFQPTLESCTLLVEAYGKAGEVYLARRHFYRISELGYKPDRSSIFKMLLAYQKYHKYDESRQFLKQFPVYYR